MGKIKSPQEKKALSLKRDRRNIFRENSKASRKGIRRGKQRSHMEERRSVGLILNRLRQGADENVATEADVLAKTSIVKSRLSAFKKTPDAPLATVIKGKLARRQDLRQPEAKNSTRAFPNLYAEGIFDTTYIRELHKRPIMYFLLFNVSAKGWARKRKKTRLVRTHERKEAARWREAILRDAPLLKGFFAEEPQWRDRIMRWCGRVLST